MRVSNKKKIQIISSCLLSASFLSGCKKQKSIYDEEYKLSIKKGIVQCDNFDYVVCIEKTKGQDFKILNFADIQLNSSEVSFGYLGDDTKAIMESLIEESNPNLITLSGDQGYGEAGPINFVGEVINKYNIPWAPVFGNHDHECRELSMKKQIELYSSYSNCLVKYGPSEITKSNVAAERAGNYIINIVEKDKTKFKIVRTIFMLNSGQSFGDYSNETNKINNANYEHLTDKQLDFYKWGLESAKKYNNGIYPKSTIIEHIPITAYAFAFAEAFNTTYDAYHFDSIVTEAKKISVADSYNDDCWTNDYKDSFGVCYETVMSSPIEDHIFEVIEQYGSTDSMLVGHDHVNNFCVNYHNVKLAYGLKTGFGSYADDKVNGGTVLTINDDGITIEHIYK